MDHSGYEALAVQVSGGIATVTIDNGPINLFDLGMYQAMAALSHELAADDDVRVVVLCSANPGWFIAHFDVELILRFPARPAPTTLSDFHLMCERFRTMPKATIAVIEGRVGGGGSELAMSFDMRFGVIGKTIVNQMEVPLGIIPGGTGTQRMPRLIGRHRALEIILGGVDLDAETAAQWGYLNRALPAGDIHAYVGALARRIASFPPEAVRLAKASVNAADQPLAVGLEEESYNFQRLIRTETGKRNMARFLEIGGQTPDGERRVADLSAELGAR